MSTGGKWVKTSGAVDALPPEGVVRHHVRLVPRDLLGEEPARARRGARSAAARPSSRTSRAARPPAVSTPNSSRKNRLPATNCRASASPPGMFVSDSTHMPPTGTNRPAATLLPDPLEELGIVLLQPGVLLGRGRGEDEVLGLLASARTTFANVRATLRTVSRTGHSQAESMCACPTAWTRCALAAGGRGQHVGERRPAAGAVPATSSGSTASIASFQRPQDLGPARRAGGQLVDQPDAASRRPARSSQTGRSSSADRRPLAAGRAARAPAVARSPSGVGANDQSPPTSGLDAASR